MTNLGHTNPFEILGLTPRFRLDAVSIEQAYLSRLTIAHPDAGGGDDLGDDSGDSVDAATLNAARAILLDDEQRAIALLELLGGPSASQCRDLPDGFLMEMMTRRQEIEEQLTQDGREGSEKARANWESWARSERASYAKAVGDLFDALSESPQSMELTKIRIELNAWRYIERLIEQLDPEYDPADADFR